MFNESPHTASCLLHMEGAINWYDRVNAVNYQLRFTWSYHLVLLSLVELLHSHNKSCHDSYGEQKLTSPMTRMETIFPLALVHTHAHPGHPERAWTEHTAIICSHLFWNQLAPAGIFPLVHWLEGISVVSLKRLEMTTEAGPGEPVFISLMTSGDFTEWQMTDSTSSIGRVLPPHQVGDCSFCNDCVRACTK